MSIFNSGVWDGLNRLEVAERLVKARQWPERQQPEGKPLELELSADAIVKAQYTVDPESVRIRLKYLNELIAGFEDNG